MNTVQQMPPMPGMLSTQNNESESANSVISSPVPAAPEMDAVGSEDVLNAPSHEEIVKPTIISQEEKISNSIVAPRIPRSGIDVVADRNGFYNQERISEGRPFKVKSFEELGEWMRCIDPDLEKKRVEFFKNKKAKK